MAGNRTKDSMKMVGEEGFEPPTFCSQSRRATRLRYTPNFRGDHVSRAAHNTHALQARQRIITRIGQKYSAFRDKGN